jgi:hypothetical protein
MRNLPVMVCVIDTGMFASSLTSDLPPGLVGGMAPTGAGADMTNQCAYNWDQGQLHGGHVMGTVAAFGNNVGVRGVSDLLLVAGAGLQQQHCGGKAGALLACCNRGHTIAVLTDAACNTTTGGRC